VAIVMHSNQIIFRLHRKRLHITSVSSLCIDKNDGVQFTIINYT